MLEEPCPYDDGQGWVNTQEWLLEPVWSCSPVVPTSLVDLLVTCDRLLVGEELGGERRWIKLNIELYDLTDCDDE